MEEVCKLPSGNSLYREPNEVGGHRYWSDAIGGGVVVWDTCLVSESELLAAVLDQHKVRYEEAERNRLPASPDAEKE